MKWLLIPAAFLLLIVAGVGYRMEGCYRKVDKMQTTIDSLQDVIAVRQWVDRRNFAKLIANVQYLNANTTIARPQLKSRLDRFEEYWQMLQELGEE